MTEGQEIPSDTRQANESSPPKLSIETKPFSRVDILFSKYIKGSTHMHTYGFNPEGGLEATLTLAEQLKYLGLISSPKTEGKQRPEYPLSFTTVTNHAEHIGLTDLELDRWNKEGKISDEEYKLIKSGIEKRKIPKGDPTATNAPGGDGWGLCTTEENAAMAKAATFNLEEQCQLVQQINAEQTITVFSGVEASVTKDGELTIPDKSILKKLDVVVASPHTNGFNHGALASNPRELVNIYKKVIDNYPVLILGHPFIDKQIQTQLAAELQFSGWQQTLPMESKTKIVRLALDPILGDLLDIMAKSHVAFEINLKSPFPQELTEAILILLKQHNVSIALGIDGHQIQQWQTVEKPDSIEKTIELDRGLSDTKAVGVKLPLRLAHLLHDFEAVGIQPDQVITSTKERLEKAIHERKEYMLL